MLRPDEPLQDTLQHRSILVLQVEPTLACALECPGCTRKSDLRTRRVPHRLTSKDFETLLEGLLKDGYQVDVIEYCGNGEPLNNPNIAEFIRVGRQFFARAKQRIITNGNFPYDEKLRSLHVDEYVVSCDGATQKSYETYRINGDLQKVFDFIKSIPSHIAGYRQKKIWKYILFEHNDSDDEILLAQSLKIELGVDELLFVRTHSEMRSTRFERGDVFPALAQGVALDQTQMVCRGQKRLLPQAPLHPLPLPEEEGFVTIDSLSVSEDGDLVARGWMLTREPRDMSLFCNGTDLRGTLIRNLHRPDVAIAYPSFQEEHSGFEYRWRSECRGEIFFSLEVYGRMLPFQAAFRFFDPNQSVSK